jgi:phosphonate transport system substrate-binding protein
MKMRYMSAISFLLLAVLFLNPVSAGENEKKLLIGLIPELNIFLQRERFQPLGAYLSKKTGLDVKFTILSRYGNLIERFAAEKMDGAFFGSFTGAAAIHKLGVIPLARPVNLDNTSTYYGYIFVRKDSNIKNVKDMKGKTMAYVDRATTAGYVFPVAYLKEHGVSSPEKYFREFYFTGSHDAAIDAVLTKKADVGAAKHSVYDREKKENSRVEKELVILAQSPPVPSNGLCVRKDLDENLKKKLKDALLGIHTDPEGQAVLKQFGALKFIETTAADYEPVNQLAVKAGIDLKKYNWKNK